MNFFLRLRDLIALARTIANEYSRDPVFRTFRIIGVLILQNRLPKRMRKPRELRLRWNEKDFSLWLLDRTGLAAFKEVFIDKQYEFTALTDIRTIIDAGANIGVASVYFLLLFPNARLFAIEPDPDTCVLLRRNLAQFRSASVHQCALTDADGNINFYVNPKSSIGSSLIARTANARTITVPGMTLDSFLASHSIDSLDLLKFDIEGAEESMFAGISDLSRIRYMVGELHPDLMATSPDKVLTRFNARHVSTTPLGSKRSIIRVNP